MCDATRELSMADHPRIRGEHIKISVTADTKKGSSPHTRGAPLDVQAGLTRGGIIPAYAGSTSTMPGMRPVRPDHPRIRGEHLSVPGAFPLLYGSSPHTRGAHVGGRRRRRVKRIIPAYAGSTVSMTCSPIVREDHPRIRGEHVILTVAAAPDARIIPAYAGSTCRTEWARNYSRDHPRIRGEHAELRLPSGNPEGSSPHTRGARKSCRI